jgi:ferritin-like metal-binding protein YciE
MGLFTCTQFDNLDDLLCDQLQDLYDAEQQLTKALPEMAEAAKSPQLKQAFQSHLRETQNHVNRIEQVFRLMGKEPKSKTCDAMKGLVSEGNHVIKAKGDDDVRDAALIAAAQRVEHYEIASYGTARSLARRLGLEQAAELLQTTLDEEGATDKKLTQLAERSINPEAARA